jgi:hypothetical protein
MFAPTNGMSSGGQSAPLHEESEVSLSSAADNTSSVKGLVSSLSDTIRNKMLGEQHIAENNAIRSRNDKLAVFLESLKSKLQQANPSLSSYDIKKLLLPDSINYQGLPDDIQGAIETLFTRLGAEKQTFGALREIVLGFKQEEEMPHKPLSKRVVQWVVDIGAKNWNDSSHELTLKQKKYTYDQIIDKFSQGETFVAVGNIFKTVYNVLGNCTIPYNPIDWLTKKAHEIGYDGSRGFLMKTGAVVIALVATPLKVISKLFRVISTVVVGFPLTALAIAVIAIGLGIIKAAKGANEWRKENFGSYNEEYFRLALAASLTNGLSQEVKHKLVQSLVASEKNITKAQVEEARANFTQILQDEGEE